MVLSLLNILYNYYLAFVNENNRISRNSLEELLNESGNILGATNEQKQALDEIAKSINVFNDTIQNIATSAQKLSDFSIELATMVQKLKSLSEIKNN